VSKKLEQEDQKEDESSHQPIQLNKKHESVHALESFQEQIAEAKRSLAAAEDKAKEVRDNYRNSKHSVNEIDTKATTLKQKIDSQEATLQKLKNSIETDRKVYSAIQDKKTGLLFKQKVLKTLKRDTEKKVQTCRQELSDATARKVEYVRKVIGEKQKRKSKMQTELNSLQSEVVALQIANGVRIAVEESGDRLKCNICMDRDKNTALQPCGHVMCGECAPRAGERCYHCRKTISAKSKIYI